MRTRILERLKSWAVWTALASQVLAILVLLEIINPTQSETINNVVVAVLQLLVIMGVLNNPTTPDQF
jgi:uncharacterized membrane protein